MSDHPGETLPATALSPTDQADELGRMRMLPGEDAQLFEELRAAVIADLQPRGIVEQIFVGEFVCQRWQALRWRRSQTNLLDLATERTRERLAAPSEAGSPTGINAAAHNLIVGEAAVAMSGAFASTLGLKLGLLERVDALLGCAQARRGSALRDLDRHREARARREQAAKRIEEAEVLTLDDADGRYKKL